MKTVAVLFAREDSIYKSLPACDVWDKARDARKWAGGSPVVAHPPCRAWGSLRHFAKPEPGERELAYFALNAVRTWGGILEHPYCSVLWKEQGLPRHLGEFDSFGGFTVRIDQCWFGHRAQKPTRLYVCGADPAQLPPFLHHVAPPSHYTSPNADVRKGHPRWRPHIRKHEREHTPPALALWLIAAARMCSGARSAADISLAA